jgi:hypothetical protein
MREKRDGSEVSSSRVAHVLLVSLTIHERRTKRAAFVNSLRAKKGIE